MSGVRLLLEHPEVATRDCEHCQAFHYDEKTGALKTLTGTDHPIPRDPECPPPCMTTVGCPKGSPDAGLELSLKNWRALEHFKQCRAVGRFPEDSIVERNAAIIDDCERAADRSQNRLQTELLKIWLTAQTP